MTLHHTRAGAGEPLVLIHGTGSYGRVWEPVLDRLTREREVWTIDLPGFGESAPLPDGTPHTAPVFATAVASFLDEQGLERPHIGGNSLGGAIGFDLAAMGRAASVTGLSPSGLWLDREAAFARASLKGAVENLERLGESVYPVLRNPVGRTLMFSQLVAKPWRMDGDAAVDATRNLVSSPATMPTVDGLRGRFGGSIAPDIPVTVAWGVRDFLLFIRQGRRAQRAIPHARFVEMPGCGHVPMSDDPELTARVLLEGSAG